ncbi:MAG: type II toxin-antitoxin system PemK/MazF family toxin [Chamaesiphon sp.]|nr:type II toxin-antitoxin system PemK/MazF family toxin [Chamaesiphon sp.]
MKEGNIILAAMLQADGQRKNRPALILREMPKYGDLLICGISTQLQQYIPDFDEIIRPEDDDFIASGLVKESLFRLAFLSVIQRKEAIGSMGMISVDRHQRLLSNLSNYLAPKP